MSFLNGKKRIFLDYASTTPVRPEVKRAMEPYLSNDFANPSALYSEGVHAKSVVESAREDIAHILGAHKDEIIFTGSGTESANLAILGAFNAYRGSRPPHFVFSAIEHPAVKECAKEIERMGGKITTVLPNKEGIISPESILRALTEQTILVSVIYANNEIGVIQPIKEIAKAIRNFSSGKNLTTLFHTDASQAPSYLSLSVSELHVDLMTLDASKIYGPKGVGLLYVRRGTSLSPLSFGGGQEKGLRSGTENVAGIVGFAEAIRYAALERGSESVRIRELRDYAIKKILTLFPNASLNGSAVNRLPNNINICFPGIDSEFAVLLLDAKGIATSYASSCRTLSSRSSSYVIDAIGKSACTSSSLRFTLGRETKKQDIDALCSILPSVIARARGSV
ncbi:MAG: cysteine desulfurase family protein [Patescibacteria group bacterium]